MKQVNGGIILFFLLIVGITSAVAQTNFKLNIGFDKNNIPPKPNYTDNNSWAALPTKKDEADRVPLKSRLSDNQANAKADVFFIYPTIFTYQPTNQYEWNADVNDATLNEKIDKSTILNQATVFNGSCKVYAPRYRQAHIYAFFTDNKSDAKQAFDVAYEDVKEAFLYYLKNWNQGRPIVIAAHSQGTVHAKRLLKELFDGKPLQKQLVEAYLVGIATQPDTFENIKPSRSAEETGGFVSWNTYARDFYPNNYKEALITAVSTNPLTWTLDETYAPRELNKGSVGLKFKLIKKAVDAQNHQGLLWINKPNIVGKAFIKTKVWHKADYNLFWSNIRENVALRVEKFMNR